MYVKKNILQEKKKPVPVPYLMYGIKTYLFSILQILYLFRTLCTGSKNVSFQYFTNSIPILYLMYGIKTYLFSTLQIPHQFRILSHIWIVTSFPKQYKKYVNSYLFFLKRI